VPTPQQRDRTARAVAAVARACGFDQPVAPLIVARVDDVRTLVQRDDATIRRVLGDARLRAPLRAAVVAAFRDVWKQATLDRLKLDHPAWLRAWWLPVCTGAELDRLLHAPVPRSDHRRVGISWTGFPTTVGAAEILVEEAHRRAIEGYLVVDRRFATAVLDLAAEVAREERRERRTGVGSDGLDQPPPTVPAADATATGWWHA
jgi:hypothetical protein